MKWLSQNFDPMHFFGGGGMGCVVLPFNHFLLLKKGTVTKKTTNFI